MITMSGEGHYQEAERLLEHAGDPTTTPDRAQTLVGRAQAHATLALAYAQLAIATTNVPSHVAESVWRVWGDK